MTDMVRNTYSYEVVVAFADEETSEYQINGVGHVERSGRWTEFYRQGEDE